MSCGLSYEDFWVNLKPKQVKEYIELYNKKQKQELQTRYTLCWLNAAYNNISRHNHKAFPSKPEQIYKEEIQTVQSDEEQDAVINFLLNT